MSSEDSHINVKRIVKEIKSLANEVEDGKPKYEVAIVKLNKPGKIYVRFTVPAGSYQGIKMVISVDFTQGFPLKPPKMHVMTPVMWHPNVANREDAWICVDFLTNDGKYCPEQSMTTTMLAVCLLLEDANHDGGHLNPAASKLLTECKKKGDLTPYRNAVLANTGPYDATYDKYFAADSPHLIKFNPPVKKAEPITVSATAIRRFARLARPPAVDVAKPDVKIEAAPASAGNDVEPDIPEPTAIKSDVSKPADNDVEPITPPTRKRSEVPPPAPKKKPPTQDSDVEEETDDDSPKPKSSRRAQSDDSSSDDSPKPKRKPARKSSRRAQSDDSSSDDSPKPKRKPTRKSSRRAQSDDSSSNDSSSEDSPSDDSPKSKRKPTRKSSRRAQSDDSSSDDSSDDSPKRKTKSKQKKVKGRK